MTSLQMEPPAPPPRRSVSTSCDLHPGETFTGFCTACLRERLAGLEDSSSAAAVAAPGRRSTSAIRSLFSRPFAAGSAAPSGSGAAAAAPPDLRRCKSFSCGRGGDALAADEPQRWLCDVRGRSTLWALFHQDDRERVRDGTAFGAFPASSSAAAAALPFEVQQHPPPPPLCVPEVFLEEEVVTAESCDDEITPVVEPIVAAGTSGEMEAYATGEVKPMKDHIDLETSQQPKKPPPPMDLKEITGSFWVAASVFSKKWQKWRRKQKLKKEEAAAGSKAAAAAMPPPEKPSFLRRSRLHGAARSEFAGGRRSCDTDPRFSLDAARMSVDDAGCSWDGPRASWDGYLFGAGAGIGLGRMLPPLSRLPPILSALEDSPAVVVQRSDGQIPVVEDDSQPEADGDVNTPGGTAQTRDYYMDTSSRRRRSLDRSSSARRRSSFEAPEPKPAPAATAIPIARESTLIGSSEFHHFHHAEDLLDHRFSCSSLIDDFPASLDTAFPPDPAKKPRGLRKAWSLWGFIHRRATGRRNGVASDDRALSEEPWPELRGARGYNARTMMMQRCSSNASARSSFSSNSGGGGMGSSRRCFVDGGVSVKRRQEEQCVLERNRSARYSPAQHHAHADKGMLRFYLTPLRSASGRRAAPGMPASGGRHLRPQSLARSMLRLY